MTDHHTDTTARLMTLAEEGDVAALVAVHRSAARRGDAALVEWCRVKAEGIQRHLGEQHLLLLRSGMVGTPFFDSSQIHFRMCQCFDVLEQDHLAEDLRQTLHSLLSVVADELAALEVKIGPTTGQTDWLTSPVPHAGGGGDA